MTHTSKHKARLAVIEALVGAHEKRARVAAKRLAESLTLLNNIETDCRAFKATTETERLRLHSQLAGLIDSDELRQASQFLHGNALCCEAKQQEAVRAYENVLHARRTLLEVRRQVQLLCHLQERLQQRHTAQRRRSEDLQVDEANRLAALGQSIC